MRQEELQDLLNSMSLQEKIDQMLQEIFMRMRTAS